MILIIRRLKNTIEILLFHYKNEIKMAYTAEEEKFLKQIGERIKYFRLLAKLSQEKLSFESNLDRTYIGSVERGERNIAIINLEKIAKALNVKLMDLVDI